ncbi:MAG: hypothetical protein GY769_12075, partial [bacterium]|nr:hypothetical protein [bacterium]
MDDRELETLLADLESTFDEVRNHVPEPSVIVGCECILRRLEVLEQN